MKIQEWLLAKEKEEGAGSTLIKDIAHHGCQGGVPGIIYYNETVAFYAAHEEEIFERTEESKRSALSRGSTRSCVPLVPEARALANLQHAQAQGSRDPAGRVLPGTVLLQLGDEPDSHLMEVVVLALEILFEEL